MINSYGFYMVFMSIVFLLYAYVTYEIKFFLPEKMENVLAFFMFGFIVLSVFTVLIGLFYETEYNNTPGCENLLNHTILHYTNGTGHGHGLQYDEETYYHYINSCDSRGVYKPGTYLQVILVWSGLIVSLFVIYGIVIMLGRLFGRW